MTDPLERLFIAVPLSGPVRENLSDWTGRLKESGTPFHKWVHPEDFHITLKFIGDTPRSTLPALSPLLEQAAAAHSPLELTAAGAGTFGPKDAPRILWAGLQGDLDALHRLQLDVEAACSSLGFEQEDRPYRPHITLARRYTGGHKWARERLDAPGEPPSASWTAEEIVVYRTHMGRSPMYERAEAFALRG
ncbi:RNA 2',3'-cyclic phosphodiesterase [Paenibacillus chitinolyticus]|uniref:RNA 2',3'-cyclic phosphodiesterase n=1 Tax=Paenibacillus chitinolyticus TaxID=79263 RepID=UPI0036DBD8FA